MPRSKNRTKARKAKQKAARADLKPNHPPKTMTRSALAAVGITVLKGR